MHAQSSGVLNRTITDSIAERTRLSLSEPLKILTSIVSALLKLTAQYLSGNFSPLSTFIIPLVSESKEAQRDEVLPANLDHAR
jgi:hypothetical protein